MFNYVRVLTYMLVFLLPAMANLVEHGGSVIFTLLTAFGLGAWFKRKTRPVFSRNEKILMLIFAGYFAVCLIFFLLNGLFSPDIPLDWDLDHEIRFLGFIPIFYLLVYWTGMKDWVVWYGLAAGALCSICYALFQAYMVKSGTRVIGPYNPIAFGDLALVYGFMALSGIRYFAKRHGLLMIIPILAVIGGLLAAFLSGTRGALLAIPVLTLIFLIQLGSFKYTWIYRVVTVLVIALSSVTYTQLSGVSIDERIHDGIEDARLFFAGEREMLKGEEAFRLRVWDEAWEVYKEHPLLGTGRKQYLETVREGSNIQCAHLHNMFLEFLVNYGIVGLAALLAVLLAPLFLLIPVIKQNYRKPRIADTAFSGINLVAAFLIFSLTTCVFYRNLYIAFYIVILAALLTLIKHKTTA